MTDDQAMTALRDAVVAASRTGDMSGFPVRQKSAHGNPPRRRFMRFCHRCTADFLGLAAGKTGERGLWDDSGAWWCSQECYDLDHPSPVPTGGEQDE